MERCTWEKKQTEQLTVNDSRQNITDVQTIASLKVVRDKSCYYK